MPKRRRQGGGLERLVLFGAMNSPPFRFVDCMAPARAARPGASMAARAFSDGR
ncbi:hypothetical protein [Xanthomonas fragariae]|uniref:hypothetical protein n=1 Tax=Xanthomonas fragariae TaxID=48664 RepID=UPI00131F075F|nr:hypothetical protein [Xanthomonas fragariae]